MPLDPNGKRPESIYAIRICARRSKPDGQLRGPDVAPRGLSPLDLMRKRKCPLVLTVSMAYCRPVRKTWIRNGYSFAMDSTNCCFDRTRFDLLYFLGAYPTEERAVLEPSRKAKYLISRFIVERETCTPRHSV
jgi:hypothetical protein